jgi:hypothetical protein
MARSAKRHRVEEREPLNFFQWISVYLAVALGCNIPIVESLYHTMFLYLDLAAVMDPARLYEVLGNCPIEVKESWWECLQRLAIPKIHSLFPSTSPFYHFDLWFSCRCSECSGFLTTRFPLRQAPDQDPDYWKIHCYQCTNLQQDHYNPINARYRDPGRWDYTRRAALRPLLAGARRCYISRPTEGANWEWWTLVCEVPGELDFYIRWSTDSFHVRQSQGEHALLWNNCDFITACTILNRPEIPVKWGRINH